MFAAPRRLALVLAAIGLYSVIAYGRATLTRVTCASRWARVADLVRLVVGEARPRHGGRRWRGHRIRVGSLIAPLLFDESPHDPWSSWS